MPPFAKKVSNIICVTRFIGGAITTTVERAVLCMLVKPSAFIACPLKGRVRI